MFSLKVLKHCSSLVVKVVVKQRPNFEPNFNTHELFVRLTTKKGRQTSVLRKTTKLFEDQKLISIISKHVTQHIYWILFYTQILNFSWINFMSSLKNLETISLSLYAFPYINMSENKSNRFYSWSSSMWVQQQALKQELKIFVFFPRIITC